MPLAKHFLGCYNECKEIKFSISFSFSYLSLFVDTPGSSGQRSRGSPLWGCPHRQCVHSLLLFVTSLPRSVSFHCSKFGFSIYGQSPLTMRAQCKYNRYFPAPLGIITTSHSAPEHFSACQKCAAGRILKGGRLFLREQDLSASLKSVLWVLSCRYKKVPPPAGISKPHLPIRRTLLCPTILPFKNTV